MIIVSVFLLSFAYFHGLILFLTVLSNRYLVLSCRCRDALDCVPCVFAYLNCNFGGPPCTYIPFGNGRASISTALSFYSVQARRLAAVGGEVPCNPFSCPLLLPLGSPPSHGHLQTAMIRMASHEADTTAIDPQDSSWTIGDMSGRRGDYGSVLNSFACAYPAFCSQPR